MAKKSSQEKWNNFNSTILETLDIKAEFELLGVEFTAVEPNMHGWLQCRAIDREDENPSAGVNIGIGPSRGRYKDFGGNGQCIGLFDFAAKYGTAADWKDARAQYAAKAGIKKPRVDEDNPRDVFAPFESPTIGQCLLYTQAKPGIGIGVIVQTGGQTSVYSVKYPKHLQQEVLVWPMWGAGYMEAEPVGYHAARSDGNQIAIHQRNKNVPDLVKTLSKGNIGLMNNWTMRHFQTASVIWLVEGLSDMLTTQTLLGENTDHLVTTLGGASARVSSLMTEVFRAKKVFICYDPDDAGDAGAWANAAILSRFTETYIVRLPVRGQDLRDWVNEGHDYHHLWQLAEQTDRVNPDSSEVIAEIQQQEQQLIHQLGCKVLGKDAYNGKLIMWNYMRRSLHFLENVAYTGYHDFALVFSPDPFFAKVSERAIDVEDGQVTMAEMKAALARASDSAPAIDVTKAYGIGCWEVGDSLLLVNGNSADVLTPDGELVALDDPMFGGELVEFPREPDWYNRDQLATCLQHAKDPDWRNNVMSNLVEWFMQFDNWAKPTDPQVLAGLVSATLLESVWEVRPHIAITGWTNTGKSTLIEKFLKPLFGNLCMSMVAPTEAAVRQSCSAGCNVILVDEFDTAADQKKVLEMARASSRKQVIVKGSRLGQPARFAIQHMLYFSGIGLDRYFHRIVDRNRFVMLELMPFKNDKETRPIPPHPAQCNDMRHKLLAMMLLGRDEIQDTIRLIEKMPYVEGRLPQMNALPTAVLAYAHDWSLDDTKFFLGKLLDDIKEDIEETMKYSNPTHDAVRQIMLHTVRLPRGMMVSMESLLAKETVFDADKTPHMSSEYTQLYGIRRYRPRYGDEGFSSSETNYRVFISPDIVCKTILKDRDVKALSVRKVLMQVPTAQAIKLDMGNGHKRGVSIDLDALFAVIDTIRINTDYDQENLDSENGF